MKTILELQKDYEKRAASAEKLREKVSAMQKQVEALAAEMDKAAAAGDLDTYRAKKREYNERAEEVYVLQKQLKDPEPIAQADAVEAWKARTKEYDRDFDKAQKELQKASEALESAFVSLLRVQADGLRDRERLARFARIETPERMFPLQMVQDAMQTVDARMRLQSPEARYLVMCGRWHVTPPYAGTGFNGLGSPKLDAAWDILHNHKPATI